MAEAATNGHEVSALRAEVSNLKIRLKEAEDTLSAIKSGEVDAFFINGEIYTLESADAASNRFRGEALALINEAVIAVDNERRIIYLNPAAERQYKIQASDVLGLPLSDVLKVQWNDGKDHSGELLGNLEAGGHWRGESVHVRKDGTTFAAESSISLLEDFNGTSGGRLAVIRDISERKRAEKELQRAHDELEIRVIERTKELADANRALKKEVDVRTKMERHRADLLQRVVSSQEDERRRIARDIHDKLGQRVTALRLQIASLSDELSQFEKFEGSIELLKRTALRLDSEVSFLAWELRPAALDDLGLPDAARAYLEDWSHNYKISSDFSLRGFTNQRLNPDVETHLYRIMQESLNNIVKHAHASRVNVLLDLNDNGVTLIVEDNGIGFDNARIEDAREAGRGLGLLGMKERVILIGGSVEIESNPGEGTTLFIRVPNAVERTSK